MSIIIILIDYRDGASYIYNMNDENNRSRANSNVSHRSQVSQKSNNSFHRNRNVIIKKTSYGNEMMEGNSQAIRMNVTYSKRGGDGETKSPLWGFDEDEEEDEKEKDIGIHQRSTRNGGSGPLPTVNMALNENESTTSISHSGSGLGFDKSGVLKGNY